MSREALVRFLQEASPIVAEIPKREPGPQTPDIEFPEQIRSAVEALLRTIPELARIERYNLQTISWGSSIGLFRVAISVLERLSMGGKPKEVVDDLIDFAGRGTARTYYLAGIGGIALDKELRLTDKVSLITANDISPSAAREFIIRIDRHGRIPGSIGHEIPRPQVALRVSNDQKVLLPTGTAAPATGALGMKDIRELERRILFSLTLASEDAAPVFTAKTSWIDHPAQSYHGITGSAGGTSPAQQYPMNYAPFNVESVSHLFKRHEQLKESDRNTLFLAVDRLRRSRLQAEPVDRAIDLRTALEIILLHQVSATQELRFRVAVHGARLLGTNAEQRAAILKVLLDAYDAGSAAVHTGQLTKRSLIDCLGPADDACCKAAIKIADDGGFPTDWKSIVLAD